MESFDLNRVLSKGLTISQIEWCLKMLPEINKSKPDRKWMILAQMATLQFNLNPPISPQNIRNSINSYLVL